MQKSFRVVLAVALIALGVWGWWILFPSPERVIRSQLKSLATDASYQANEGALARVGNVAQLGRFFTTDVTISGDVPGRGTQTLNGRDEIQQAAMAARQQWTTLKVEFVDINVTLGPDGQTAVANLTAKITPAGQRDFTPQEMNFMFRKFGRNWLIYHVETVKTLS